MNIREYYNDKNDGKLKPGKKGLQSHLSLLLMIICEWYFEFPTGYRSAAGSLFISCRLFVNRLWIGCRLVVDRLSTGCPFFLYNIRIHVFLMINVKIKVWVHCCHLFQVSRWTRLSGTSWKRVWRNWILKLNEVERMSPQYIMHYLCSTVRKPESCS